MKIESGLFAGIEVPDHEIAFLFNDGCEPTPWWAPAFRTPHFLAKFSPFAGWQVLVTPSAGDFNLPDYNNRPPGGAPPEQPTQKFEAQLIKEGVVYANASSLELIDGEKAWERGETNARGRLYDALGLPGNLKNVQIPVPSKQSARPPLVVAMPGRSRDPAPTIIDVVQSDSVATQEGQPVVESKRDDDMPTARPAELDAVATVAAPAAAAEPPALTVVPDVASTQDSREPIRHAPGINANLLSQIERQARLSGKAMRSLTNNDDAKAFFRELLSTPAPAAS